MPSRDDLPSVAVIVLNWNGTDDTVECLRSVAGLDYPRYQVVVVDNGSQPSPRARLTGEFPDATYLETGVNLGYAGGNNVGIRHAVAAGFDYVFVLNNDTVVEPDVLRHAVGAARVDSRVAAVGAKIMAWDTPGRVWVAYGEVTYRQSLVRLVGYDAPDDGRFDTQQDVEWVPGTAMLLSRAALESVGSFDERFFAYHEDVDWCTRARQQGLRVVFAPRARVLHKGNRSSGGPGYVTPRQYLSGRNMVLYVRKHATIAQALKFLGFQLATLPLQYGRRFLSGEQAGVTLKVRGMIDGWRNRPLPLAELGLRPKANSLSDPAALSDPTGSGP